MPYLSTSDLRRLRKNPRHRDFSRGISRARRPQAQIFEQCQSLTGGANGTTLAPFLSEREENLREDPKMRILIATDGSEYSDAAIDEACRYLIRPENAEVMIVSAYEDSYPIAAEPFAISAEYYQKLDEAVCDMAKNFADAGKKAVLKHFPDAKFPIQTEVLHGAPDQQVLDLASEWKADVIVVGSHGRGFWGRLLGSVSNGVVHHAGCSVFVVRKHPAQSGTNGSNGR